LKATDDIAPPQSASFRSLKIFDGPADASLANREKLPPRPLVARAPAGYYDKFCLTKTPFRN
jgi:hypothetical protein